MSVSPDATTPAADDSIVEHRSIAAGRPFLLGAHLALGKVRLNALVVVTTALGFVVGSKLNHFPITGLYPAGFDWGRLFWTCAGTFLAAVGASAFNQAVEAPRDARMRRTHRRPLCTGQLSRTYAAALGLIVSLSGVVLLGGRANHLTAGLAAGNLLLYIAVYTPLKPVSTVNTLVGAVVGGVPPILGWTAAAGELSAGALALGAILFAWQIPHFLALCWMYRQDYGRGGFKMMPIQDATGHLTSRVALLYAALLMPLCLLVAWLGHAGPGFVGVSLALTAALTMMAAAFVRTRAQAQARRLFIATIVYLPLLCIALMVDARGPLSTLEATPAGFVQPAPAGETFIDPSGAEAQRLNAAWVPTTAPESAPADQNIRQR
jgi:heme o synthase